MSGVALGVDLATASGRCVAIDTTDGEVLASATADLPAPVRDGAGASTQRPAYAQVALELVARVSRDLGSRAASIAAVSVTGTSGTVVPCDQDGVAVGDARLYDDSSGAAAASAVGLSGGAMLGRVTVLARETRAASYASTADVVANAFLRQRSSGDTSHWLKAGIDASAATWPESAVDALGLDPAALPRLVHPGTRLGTVDGSVAARLRLPAGVAVVAGMTDGCTAQVATGAVRTGDTVGVLGTTLVLKAVSDAPVSTPDGVVYSHLAPDGRWWPGGASNTGAGVLAHEFAHVDLAAMDEAVAGRPATVVRYPLSGVGERFPLSDPRLRSLTSGKSRGREDAYRGVLEGVAFVERLGLERLAALGVTPRRHVLAGGTSASRVWNAIRATVLAPLVPVEVTGRAGSAVGAAVLAAHGLDDTGDFAATVARLVRPSTPVEPVAAQKNALQDSYGRFLDLVRMTLT